ncbi:MAG: hypothetical protein KJO07_03660 [Deltaproteobacteria bacterium]|nr:hypothetical protein [Deltaproteobacteria bacterium]
MARLAVSIALPILLLAGPALAQPDGPPGLGSDTLAGEANLLTPDLQAPDQSAETPGLSLLRQVVHRQTLHLRGGNIVVEIDGSVKVTPLYGVFTLRFGTRDRYSLQVRRALESTFEGRAEMANQYRAAAMEFALGDLPRYLRGVWLSPWPVETRKRVLFALWDECAERGRKDVINGGSKARYIIEAFIRWQLPQDSRHAFTAGELAVLNRGRSSEARFEPYRRQLIVPGKTVALALTF